MSKFHNHETRNVQTVLCIKLIYILLWESQSMVIWACMKHQRSPQKDFFAHCTFYVCSQHHQKVKELLQYSSISTIFGTLEYFISLVYHSTPQTSAPSITCIKKYVVRIRWDEKCSFHLHYPIFNTQFYIINFYSTLLYFNTFLYRKLTTYFLTLIMLKVLFSSLLYRH